MLLSTKIEPASARPAQDPLAVAPQDCSDSPLRGLSRDNATARRSFYLASELEDLDRQFDPSRWSGRQLQHVDLLPGDCRCDSSSAELWLDVQTRSGIEGCVATGLQRPGRCFDVDLVCGYAVSAGAGGQRADQIHPRHARWIWIDSHRALTDLLPIETAGAAPPRKPGVFEALPLLKEPDYPDFTLQEVVETDHPPDVAWLLQKARDEDAAAIAGNYRDSAGTELTVTPDGRLTVGGIEVPVALHRCTSGSDRAPCLVAQSGHEDTTPGTRAWLLVERREGSQLLTGWIADDGGPYPFDRDDHAAFFRSPRGGR